MNPKNTIALIVGFLVLVLTFNTVGCQRIDAGHVGIKVNLYGDDKGVDDVTEVTGMVWYNKWTTEIHEFPTYVQSATFTEGEDEGSEYNEEFRVTTKDGMSVGFDVNMLYSTPAHEVPFIFKKYRKPFDELKMTVIRNLMREGFNNIASRYTADQLYEKRDQYEADSEKKIKELLEKDGFIVENIVITNDLRLPETVVDNITNKVGAMQIALKKQQEVQQAIADAQKKIETARGDSAAIMIRAQADAKAFELKQRSLTKELLEEKWIDKWDGKLPVYGETPALVKMQ